MIHKMLRSNFERQRERERKWQEEVRKNERMQRVQVNSNQRGTNFLKGYGIHTYARSSVPFSLEKRIKESLSRLGERYIGAVFWKNYRGKAYEGRVKSVVWNRTLGYGARVVYSDLWEERLGFRELNSLLDQYRITTMVQRNLRRLND